jgi:hypothetical protein
VLLYSCLKGDTDMGKKDMGDFQETGKVRHLESDSVIEGQDPNAKPEVESSIVTDLNKHKHEK